ncbi:hypothetical protein WHR41_02379 [Cladosporium halotolerans]|uniref:Uncharacterized protein n=1 Tax=Cladosporium halotolerans TaxID=1052096 RepID=A0AB34KVA6_9PEZI
MSALARPTTILAGLAVAGAATTFTARNKATDFAPASMASAEIDAAGKPVVPKAKLPSEFFHFTTKSGIDFRN